MAPSSRGSSSDASSVYERSTSPSRRPTSPPSSITSNDGLNHDDNFLQTQNLPLRSYHEEYACPFRFLKCPLVYKREAFDDWYAHSLSHFGSQQPPSRSICIFCDTSFHDDDPWRSWQERMHHIANHFNDGSPIEHARPDFALLLHLQANSLITEEQYDNAIRAHEGLPVDGLRPHNWIPKKIRLQIYKEERRSNQVEQKVERRKKYKQKDHASRRGRTAVIVHQDGYSSQPKQLPEMTIEQVPSLEPHVVHEANQFLIDSSSFLTGSDVSSEDGLSDVASEEELDIKPPLPGYLPPDVNMDEDLMDPERHYQLLKDIQDRAFTNSTALQLEYMPQATIKYEGNEPRSSCDSYTECCAMLRRIRQNIHMLQELGFCQGRLSFLKVDPRRTNVALLIGIPVENILRLGEGFDEGQAPSSQTNSMPTYCSTTSMVPKNGFGGGRGRNPTGQAVQKRNPIFHPSNRLDPYAKHPSQGRVKDGKAIISMVYSGEGNDDSEPRHILLRVPDQSNCRFSLTVYSYRDDLCCISPKSFPRSDFRYIT